MPNDLFGLASKLEEKADLIEQAASDAAVATALAIVGDLAYKTPVDTSQALSNWQVTLGSPAESKINAYYPGQRGSSQRASAAQVLNLAKAVLSQKKPGQPIYITNNLPYIRKLNEGSSLQQPAGFVERAVLLGRLQARKFKLKD